MTTYVSEGPYRNDIVILEQPNGESVREYEADSGFTSIHAGSAVELSGGKLIAVATEANCIGVVVPHSGEVLKDPVTSTYQVVTELAQVADRYIDYNGQTVGEVNDALEARHVQVVTSQAVEIVN